MITLNSITNGKHENNIRWVKRTYKSHIELKWLHKHNKHFMKGTLFQPRFRRKKDTWCDMTHSVIYYQAWVRWLLCNDIIPKAIPLSERLAQCPNLAGHVNTMKLVELARTHRLWYTLDCSSHMRDGCMGWHWQLLMTTPWHSLPHHPSIKPTLFHSLSTLIQHALAWGHSVIVPTSLFWHCVAGTLPVGTLADAHTFVIVNWKNGVVTKGHNEMKKKGSEGATWGFVLCFFSFVTADEGVQPPHSTSSGLHEGSDE